MGKPRLENIVGLIRECKLGIHDLSRVGARMPDLPRFNMPFECGVFVGAQMFGGPAHASKAFLLLEAKAYRAQKTLSDAAGLDPRVHNNSVKRIVVCVRDFLADHINPRPLGSDYMYSTYQSFAAAYPALARRYGHEARQLKSLETFADWQWIAADWLRARAAIVR